MPCRSLKLILAFGLATSAGPAFASDLLLRAGGGHVVEAHINGRPLRLRVDPESPGYVILNPAAAERVGVQPSQGHSRTIIGPVRVRGEQAIVPVRFGSIVTRKQVVWTDREAVSVADGTISPADLPYDRVIMQLGAPQPGEHTVRLPMHFDRSLSLYHSLVFDGRPVHFRISTIRAESLATAAAGALLSQEYGSTWLGELRPMMIKYQIVRPVRPLALDAPVAFAGRPFIRFLVRTTDHRGQAILPSDQSDDLDEILVTAEIGREPPRYVVSLGRNWLSGCSSLTWDNVAREMSLSCAASDSATLPTG